MRLPCLTAASTLLAVCLAYGAAPSSAPENSAPPAAPTLPQSNRLDPAFPSSNTEHWRVDESEIARIGDGSFDKGLNLIGGAGFRLFGMTTAGDDGKAGWHLFKRPAWNLPVARPRFEYRRIDSVGIDKLGDGTFGRGMQKIEQDRWELVAYTSERSGQIGWFYFERPVAQPAP